MREILFRGKRVSNGEWVIGGIMKSFHPNYDCRNEVEFLSQKPNCYCICANNKDYFVEQESIGQYTGLTDKNGKKIFEGDIVRWDGTEISQIRYCDGVYRLCNAEGYYGVSVHNHYSYIEVIGNIHDNPGLLRTPQNDEVR